MLMLENFDMAGAADLLAKLYDKLAGWLESLVVMLPNLLLAISIIGLGALAFGDSSINFQLRIWLTDSSELAYFRARSEAMG